MLKYIKSMFSDERGAISSKRFISILGAFVLYGRFLYHAEQWLGDLIFMIIVAGLGLTTLDKIYNK